ncbi:MAG: hypothetical protein ACFE9T_00615 [Promethearchaeota archaeon]
MLTTINSEEFIFYIDLSTNFMKKKSLIKAIGAFIKEKNRFNALSSYGIVIFQKDDNPITVYDLKETEKVLNTLNEVWDTREVEQSYLENGLYEILAYIFRRSRVARKNYRVIIISDTPSKLSEEYHLALYDLLIKAKKFSAFIDIIRVGDKKFYDDDVKLKVISSETQGGTFYCNDEKLFQNILGSLIQNKQEFKVIQTDEDPVLEEDQTFYEGLAVDLITLTPDDEEICTICELELCPICEAYSDEIYKCFNCNAKFHNCCAAKYSLAKNIGFKHIFRCPQCETLLKLDEEFVNMIYEEDQEEELGKVSVIEQSTEEEYYQEKFIEEELEQKQYEEDSEFELEIKSLKPPSMPLKRLPRPEMTKKVRVGGFFGREIEVKVNNNKLKESGSQITGQDLKASVDLEKIEENISITALKPPKKRSSVKLCRICGATLQLYDVKTCPVCGAKID